MTKTEQLTAIIDSYFNGQIEQMTRQIDEFNNMYDVFELIQDTIQDLGFSRTKSNEHLAAIVIKYHRIKFR